MEHFKGINDQERYNNELMSHTRKQTELLEQIAQLLKLQQGGNKIGTNHRPKRDGGSSSNAK